MAWRGEHFVPWGSAADWDRFAPEVVSTIAGGQVLALGAANGEGTVDGGSLGDGGDRRAFRLRGFAAQDVEARLDFRLSGAGDPAQTGIFVYRDTGPPITVWTNVFFGATGDLLLGAWDYTNPDVLNTNQQAWSHRLRVNGVPQVFAPQDTVRVVKVRVDDAGKRLRIKQWVRSEPEPAWQYDGLPPSVASDGPGDIGLVIAHTGFNHGDIFIDSMSVTNLDGYVSLPDVKLWMRFDPEDINQPHPDDPLTLAAIRGVARWTEKKCKRRFHQVHEARAFVASDHYNLALGHYGDLVSVDSLTTDEDGDGIFETTWVEGVDFELRPRDVDECEPYRSIRAIGRQFPINSTAGGRVERIRVQGTWGWPEVPDDVVTGNKIQVARVVKRKEAPEGILGLNQFGVLRVSGKMDPDVRDLIGPYRLRSLG